MIQHLQTKEPTVTNHSGLSDVSIGALHKKVDEMEAVLTGTLTGRGASTEAMPGPTGGPRMMKKPVGPLARLARRKEASQRQQGREGEDGSESESDEEGNHEDEGEQEQPHSPLKDMLAFASSAAATATAAPSWLSRNFSGSEPSDLRAHSPSLASKIHMKLAEAAEIKPFAGADLAPVSVARAQVEVEVELDAKKQLDAAETERITAEAEKLAAQLEAVLKSLETRREESTVSPIITLKYFVSVDDLLTGRMITACSRSLGGKSRSCRFEDCGAGEGGW